MKEQEKYIITSEGGSVVNNLPANVRSYRKHGFNPWVGKILRRRNWQPTQVFLPEKSHGQRNLAGYSPYESKRVRCDWVTWAYNKTETLTDWPLLVKTSCPTKANKTYQDTKSWITKLGSHSFLRAQAASVMSDSLLWTVACHTLLFMEFSGQE